MIVWGCFAIFLCFRPTPTRIWIKRYNFVQVLIVDNGATITAGTCKVDVPFVFARNRFAELAVRKSGRVVTKRWIFTLKFSVFHFHSGSRSRFNYIFNFPYLSDATEDCTTVKYMLDRRRKKIKNKRALCSAFTSFPFRLFPCKTRRNLTEINFKPSKKFFFYYNTIVILILRQKIGSSVWRKHEDKKNFCYCINALSPDVK